MNKEKLRPSIRALLSFLIAPFIGILSITILPLILYSIKSNKEIDASGLESMTFLSFIFGAPIAYLLMLVLGLPVIRIIEKKRPKLFIAYVSYLAFATLPFVLLTFFQPAFLILAQGAFTSALVTSFFMLFKRQAW